MRIGILEQQSGRGSITSPLRVLVCLLLVALLIYNPFIALFRSHTGLTLHLPPSNRSTVGASELQHFSPVGKDLRLAICLAVCLGGTFLLVTEHLLPSTLENAPAPVVPNDLSSNLWFRPPPAL